MALPKLKIQKVTRFGAINHMIAIDDKWITTVENLTVEVNNQSRVTITFVVDNIESLPTFDGNPEEWAKPNGVWQD